MKLIQVIPLSRGISKETLSYFTSMDVSPGSMVKVDLRNRSISAIVVSSEDVSSAKTQIKSASYAIKKVDSLKSEDFLSTEFMNTAKEVADYFASSTGSLLSSLIPSAFLANVSDFNLKPIGQLPNTYSTEKFVVQGSDEDRYTYYRSLIREEFAKKSSIFFLVPTLEDAKQAKEMLQKGIEDYTFVLHGGMTKKIMTTTWNTIHKENHPVVIIATGLFLHFKRKDISTIIIERENSRSYRAQVRPYTDIRYVAEKLSEKIKAKLILGDILLRAETLYRESSGELIQSGTFKFRSLSTAQEQLIDMRQYKNPQGTFKILSDQVENLITQTREQSEHMFILTTRRGVAPSTVCGDCQNIVKCNNCRSPIVLHKSSDDEKSFFLCHRCGERRSTEELCKVCQSWKLGTVGIGIDMIEEKIKDRFKDIKIFRLDSDVSKTEKSSLDIVQKFYNSPGSILLGTEMALLYLKEKIHNSAIISLDSLLSVPDFRIHERIFYMLLKIRYLTSKSFILQTRNADEVVLELALKGNLIDFSRLQIEERKQFKYPPFTTLIKITLEGEKNQIVKEMDSIQTLLEPYEVDVFPAFTYSKRGKNVLHGLIKIERKNWVDEILLEKLKSLPPNILIKVDPDSLL